MVTKQQAVNRLVAACPDFDGAWQDHLEYWKGEPAGEYFDLGALAQWIVDQVAAQRLDCFEALFNELEILLGGASDELRDLLVVGFLEGLQNVAANRGIDPDVALRFLGPESRRGWFQLITMWHGPDGTGWVGQKREN